MFNNFINFVNILFEIYGKLVKILILNWQDIKNPLGGGAEVHMHEIFSRIAQIKGNTVHLLSCKIPGFPNYEVIDGIHVFRKGNRSVFNFYVPLLYKKLNLKYDYDIIIDDINKIPFYTPLFVKKPLLAISHHFFGKSIFREANAIAGTYVYLSEYLVNLVYKSTKFVVVSQSTLDEFKERGFDVSNFNIVTNAIAQENFPMKLCAKNESMTVLYFGRLKKYKSVDHLFYAFEKVKKLVPNSKLEIIGRGDFRPYLEKLAIKLNIADSVIFHGFVNEDEKSNLLAKSHVAVNTSMKEGWGITNIEANACGTPVISADVPGLRDSVANGLSGLLYEYGNIDDLSNRILEIFTDEKLRSKLSIGAIEWAKTFSWDKSATEMIDIMDSILTKRKV